MITCKLCSTRLEKKHLRRDGSLLCPECGQVYWKSAIRKALEDTSGYQPAARRPKHMQRVSTPRLTRV